MQIDTSKIGAAIAANWRSTVTGLISCAIAVVIAVSALPPGVKWTVVALAVLRAISGWLEKDAK